MKDLLSDWRVLLLSIPVLLILRTIIVGVYNKFLRPGKKLTKYGKWAIVTGATDGIGLAISHELARKGLNLVLISRSQDKLGAAAVEIRQKYPKVETRELDIDFSVFNAISKSRVVSIVRELEVGILVNNVGMSYDYPDNYHLLSQDAVQALIDLNVSSTAMMSHAVLPGMLDRKRGLIVNISSAASLFPNPLLAGYSAAKAYVDQLARSLDAEYHRAGIKVQTINPLYVATKMAKMRPSLMVPSASKFAKVAVAHFGYETQCSPYWAHAAQLALIPFLPQSLFSNYVYGMHVAIRKRALKKKERPTKQE